MAYIRVIMAQDIEVPDEWWTNQAEGGESAWVEIINHAMIPSGLRVCGALDPGDKGHDIPLLEFELADTGWTKT